MKRWLGLLAVLMLAGVVVWFVPRYMEPLKFRFERVQIGMTRPEVESIMGRGREESDWLRWEEKDLSRFYGTQFEGDRVARKWIYP